MFTFLVLFLLASLLLSCFDFYAVICLLFSLFVRILRRRRFTGIDIWLLWLCDNYFHRYHYFPPRFLCRNWNLTIRITVRGLQFLLKKNDVTSRKSVNSNNIVEYSSQRAQSFKIKSFPLFTKSLSWMKRTSPKEAIIFSLPLSTALNKSLWTSLGGNFRLISSV